MLVKIVEELTLDQGADQDQPGKTLACHTLHQMQDQLLLLKTIAYQQAQMLEKVQMIKQKNQLVESQLL